MSPSSSWTGRFLTCRTRALGDSDQLAVLQDLYVVGTPYGLENSFTVGDVSARRKE